MLREIEFRREMNRNYMVIHSEPERNDTYTMRMVSRNKVPGLLLFQEKWVDGCSMFYYDITSKQPLNRLLEYRKLTARELRTLVSDLLAVLRQMERYLLDERYLNLNPEYIYIEPESYHSSFCLIPGYQSDFSQAFFELAQYILDHVDHSDGEAVVLAFSIFRECRKENFGVEDVERCLGGESGKDDRENGREKNQEPQRIQEIMEGKIEDTLDEELNGAVDSDKLADWNVFAELATVMITGLLIGAPLAMVLLTGVRGIIRWKYILASMEMVLAVGLMFLLHCKKVSKDSNTNGECDLQEEENVLKYLKLEQDCYTERQAENGGENIKENVKVRIDNIEEGTSEDDLQTVLLTSQTRFQAKRKLISVDDGMEISIEYFPFLIGKSRSMTDFCLNQPGVSRLHVKLEEKEGNILVTDLNSTNGTKINQELLEANETRVIHEYDELNIAGNRFRFR